MNKHIFTFNKKRGFLPLLLAGVTFWHANAQAQEARNLDEVVVTGTKFELPEEKSGKTIYKLDQADIERNAGKTITDLLNEVPGIQIDGNFSAPGTNISYFVRGASSKNTLILIDGTPINDPSLADATYDLRLLPLDQVESIEVLRGGLSTLYGTGASAAVINIKLKSGNQNKTFGGSADFSGGSFNTYRGNLSLNGQSDRFNYLVSGSLYHSQGFSAAADTVPDVEFGRDGIDRKDLMVKMGYQFSDRFSLGFLSGYDAMKADYDGGPFLDAQNLQTSNQLRFGLTPTYTYSKGAIKLKSVYNISEREFISSFPSIYEGRNLQLDLTQEHQLLEGLKGLWGVNLQQLSYEQPGEIVFEDNQFTLVDPYASFFYDAPSGFNIHVGARVNTHTNYDAKFIYNVNPSYLFDISETVSAKILASVATSYVTPTLYQLNSPDYGNSLLNPEESLNYEQGISFYIGNQFTFNLVHFTRDESSPIEFVSLFDENGGYIGGEYQNTTDQRRVEGFEADFSWLVNQYFSMTANFAHVSTDKPETFYRVPGSKWGMAFNANPAENTQVSLKYNYTSSRTVYDYGVGGAFDLDSYGLVDLFVQQRLLNDKLNVYGGVNNLLDEDFNAIYGYTTRGRNFSIGARYQF
ncbi:TonB-dependent receptor plug domain-containing protein [Echinicola vietnamensis]|uniref:Outer membrane cobalamin receptor protein n=1 Tax=Echinicola vietnamensis (strain DSM 17526 / LMG 23754 / KMM 6221) TaxID=926556 RepID=L0G364_ECHVK|nr:TonB-dependent receptor plug domain-containing protein [Echinicola vietnamensis]AGA79967.1 outer membrane cobalamin receptor protein [Echinicola vietnamensis DSM 17526]